MTDRSLRVLVLADSRSFHTERYVPELRRQGCEVLLASLEHGVMEHHPLKKRGLFRQMHYPLAAAEARSLIASFKPDVVNPHFASGYGFLAALAVRRNSRPVLLHVWGSDILIAPRKSFFHRRKTKVALESAKCVVGDSAYLLDAANQIGQLQVGKTIAWGIERVCLKWHRADYTLGRPLRLIVPRSHQQVYNNLFIVRALASMINAGTIELTFPIFGSQYESFVTETRKIVGDKLKYYTKLPREAYLKFASEHDAYLSAALSDSSPASMLEAMGLGLIPIASDIPGVREWLTPESGYRFDLLDERSLLDVVTKLIESGSDFTAMRRHNLARIKQQAIFEDNIAETIDIMHRLVAGETI